jgi:hypothetical protein
MKAPKHPPKWWDDCADDIDDCLLYPYFAYSKRQLKAPCQTQSTRSDLPGKRFR